MGAVEDNNALEENVDTLDSNIETSSDADEKVLGRYNILDNIDLCMTCVSKTPPTLPLREELVSFGIEIIYNAKGAGQKAASKERQKKLAKRKRRKKMFVLLKLKGAKNKKESEKIELVAISYDKYLKAMQRNSDLPTIHEKKEIKRKSKGNRRKDKSNIVDEIDLTPECFQKTFVEEKTNMHIIKPNSMSFFGKKKLSEKEEIPFGRLDDDSYSCSQYTEVTDCEDDHVIPILQDEDECYSNKGNLPGSEFEDSLYSDEAYGFFPQDENVIIMKTEYDGQKNNRRSMAQLNIALEQSIASCTYRNDKLDEYEKQMKKQKLAMTTNSTKITNVMLLNTIHSQVSLLNHFDEPNNNNNNSKGRPRSKLYTKKDDVMPSTKGMQYSQNLFSSKSIAKGTVLTIDDVEKKPPSQNCYSLGKMTGQLGIHIDPEDKHLLKTALQKNYEVKGEKEDIALEPSPPPKDIILMSDSETATKKCLAKKKKNNSISTQATEFLKALETVADNNDATGNELEKKNEHRMIGKVVSDHTDDQSGSEMSLETFVTGVDTYSSLVDSEIVTEEDLGTVDNELVNRMLVFHEAISSNKSAAFQMDGSTYLIPQQYSPDEDDYLSTSASWRSFSDSDSDVSITTPQSREISPFIKTSSSLSSSNSSQQTENDIGDKLIKCDSPPSPCDVMDESAYSIDNIDDDFQKNSRIATYTTGNVEIENFVCETDNKDDSTPHEDSSKPFFPTGENEELDEAENDTLVSVIWNGLAHQCGKPFESIKSPDNLNTPIVPNNEIHNSLAVVTKNNASVKIRSTDDKSCFLSGKIDIKYISSRKRSLKSASDRSNKSSNCRVRVEANHTFLETIMEDKSVTDDNLPLRVKKGKNRKSCPIMV